MGKYLSRRKAPRGRTSATDEPRVVRPLFFHTHAAATLGADAWVHAQIMRRLDRARHEVHLAYVEDVDGRPTPLHLELRDVDDLHRVPIGPGPRRLARRSLRSAVGVGVALARSTMDFARIVFHVRRRRIDLLHTADRPRDAIATVVLARLCRRPSVVHVHVAFADWMRGALRWAIMSADHRVAVSEFVRAGLIEAGADPSTTHVVLNAIDDERWHPASDQRVAVREELGLPADAIAVITVCRLFESKGPRELIAAIASVAEQAPEVHLVIVGRDHRPDQAFVRSLDDLADDLGIRDRVHFTGHRPDVPNLMAASDVFAMPSTEEPFGLVFAEAMATGLPVVALDDGGTPEVVRDGVDGLLSSYGDHEALVRNLLLLVTDAELRGRLAANGMARVSERFTVMRQAEEVADLYQRVTMQRTNLR